MLGCPDLRVMYETVKCAGFEPDAVYKECVKKLSAIVLSTAAFEAPGVKEGGAVQQKGQLHNDLASLPWHGGNMEAFLVSAKELKHPRQELRRDLPEDFLAAVRFIARKRDDVPQLRQKRLQLIGEIAERLQPLNACMRDMMPAHVLCVCGEYNLALMSAMCDATQFPDTHLVRRFIKGFPIYGELACTGVYAKGGELPTHDFAQEMTPAKNYEFNTSLRRSVARRAEQALAAGVESESWQSMEAVWEATIKEVREAWCVGGGHTEPVACEGEMARGMSQRELENHPWIRGKTYRLIRRFGVYQNDKWRPVDDATENMINACTGSTEKIKLITPDHTARAARAFVQAYDEIGVEVPAVEQGTDDAKKYFRRFPNADPAYMVIALWDPRVRVFEATSVVYFILPSFIFGCYSAVFASSRYTAYLTHISRRLLGIPTGGYVDDFSVVEPPCTLGSGQDAMGEVADYVIGFADDKHVPMNQLTLFIGVQTDMRWIPILFEVFISVTDKRRRKLREILQPYVDLRFGEALRLTHAQALKLFGKSRFVLCPVFGRLGLAALQGLQIRARSTQVTVQSDVHRAVCFLDRAVSLLRPTIFPLRPACKRPVPVIFTDACDKKGVLQGLGVFIWCPYRQQSWYTFAPAPAWMMQLFQRLKFKKTYIGQLELVAAVVAYLTFPDVLSDRLCHHFIDNQPGGVLFADLRLLG